MRATRVVLLLLVVGAALTVVLGTASDTRATGDRPLELDFGATNSAFVGFEQLPVDQANGTTDLLVSVSNRFPDPVRFDSVRIETVDRSEALAPAKTVASGERVRGTLPNVTCGARLRVHAVGSDVDVAFTRHVACSTRLTGR